MLWFSIVKENDWWLNGLCLLKIVSSQYEANACSLLRSNYTGIIHIMVILHITYHISPLKKHTHTQRENSFKNCIWKWPSRFFSATQVCSQPVVGTYSELGWASGHLQTLRVDLYGQLVPWSTAMGSYSRRCTYSPWPATLCSWQVHHCCSLMQESLNLIKIVQALLPLVVVEASYTRDEEPRAFQ